MTEQSRQSFFAFRQRMSEQLGTPEAIVARFAAGPMAGHAVLNRNDHLCPFSSHRTLPDALCLRSRRADAVWGSAS